MATGQQCKRVASEASNDPCRPTLCALGAEPHAHCPCGLPMVVGARLCDLCRAEGLRPRGLKAASYLEVWDGQSYPSLRLHRPTDAPRERYEAFLRVVLGPVVRGEAAGPGEAA